MTNIQGLITNTIQTWNRIDPLIQRLNPSIEKVISSLNNFNEVEQALNEVVEDWFHVYNEKRFKFIYDLNSRILNSVIRLCEYAYFNIYNETVETKEILNQEIIDAYNGYHNDFQEALKSCVSQIDVNNNSFIEEEDSPLFDKNLSLLKEIESTISK